MRDRFGRDINYGQGDRDWDRWDRDEGHDRDHGRTTQRGHGDYTLDEGRFAAGRERGQGEHDRGFSGYGRDENRGYGGYGREPERGYGDHGREPERGFSGYGRDENRGYGRDYGREPERGYGRDYGREPERGYGRDYGREPERGFGGYGREPERGYGRDYGREPERGFGGYGREPERGWGRDQDRGFGQGFVRDVRDAGRSAMQSVSGALSSAGDRVRSALGRGPKGYRRSDSRILEDICEMLADRDDIDAGEVTVRVQDCEVTLEGTVNERHHKRIIEQIAESARGVEDVHNQIRVQRPGATTTAAPAIGTMGTGTASTAGTTGAQQTTPRGMANDVARR
ncbi:BON domain-containing protein [Sorangium sp. So ce176]|uniref:BON domain-containing protein n=1 Tax=Sorangium sp. So ce176 TaxID=3133286 RepID=UPI003F630478